MSIAKPILIRGGTIVDPSRGIHELGDIFIQHGCIVDLPGTPPRTAQVIDATGHLVVPGLIDMHVHLREPGAEYAETIQTGTAAAVAGGFTAVGCMPNTQPALDTAEMIALVLDKARWRGHCRVYPLGCLTLGRKGQELAGYGDLAGAGAVAFSDDGTGVADLAVMTAAFKALAVHDHIAVQHCEDPAFPKGVMHEGAVSRALGLPGISPLAEERMIERDLLLAHKHGARYHVAHISTARAVELVREAKRNGLRVTTEICPHHLLLTDEDCRTQDPNYKMHPPLRTRDDVLACIEGVADGTVDMLVTDHAPHAAEHKARGFRAAPPGIIGLETSLALFVKALVEPGHITWNRLIELMSSAPARIFGLPGGTLAPGAPADITLIDPARQWTIDVQRFASRSRNCPFHGWNVRGRAVGTIVGGRVAFEVTRFPVPDP